MKITHVLPWVFFVKKSSFLNFTLNIPDDLAHEDNFFKISFSNGGTLAITGFKSGKLFSERLKLKIN